MKQARVHLLERESFSDAFGPKAKRKRPKLLAASYESLAKKADGSQGNYFHVLDFFPLFQPIHSVELYGQLFVYDLHLEELYIKFLKIVAIFFISNLKWFLT